MNSAARDKIVKSWSGVNETALIKEVATKGEFIELCIEYLATKKKITKDESQKYFDNIVNIYIQRLLTEKLIYKAESVLNNLNRDVKSVYFQFGFECQDKTIAAVVWEYFKKKDSLGFPNEYKKYRSLWKNLEEIKKYEYLKHEAQLLMGDLILANFQKLREEDRNEILMKLYFINKNSTLLETLDKTTLWRYLIANNFEDELIRWCLQSFENRSSLKPSSWPGLQAKYKEWTVDTSMCEFLLENFKNPSNVLRNLLASQGHFWSDECNAPNKVLKRIFTTETYDKQNSIVNSLPIAKLIHNQGVYQMLLEDFVSKSQVEEVCQNEAENLELLQLVLALKNNDLNKPSNLLNVSSCLNKYINVVKPQTLEQNQMVAFFEFMLKNPTMEEFKESLAAQTFHEIPYLKFLTDRFGLSLNISGSNLSAYDFFKKFKKVDLQEISKDLYSEEMASFSNRRLCQKYSKKFKMNFLHFLKQRRSSYAVYYFFIEHLQGYSQISKGHFFSSVETVTELALNNVSNIDLVAHCVAFIEMLGFDTQLLRNRIKLSKLVGAKTDVNYAELLESAEMKISESAFDDFPLQEYQALMRISRSYKTKNCPEIIMTKFANNDDWWKIIVLFEYFEIPITHIRNIVKKFASPTMGEHILRALSFEPMPDHKNKRRTSFSRQKSRTKSDNSQTTISAETMTSSISSNEPNMLFRSTNQIRFLQESTDPDIIAIILISSNNLPEEKFPNSLSLQKILEIILDSHSYSTSYNLLKNCVKFRLPILSVLAATLNSRNVDWCWMVWLGVASNSFKEIIEPAKKVKNISVELIEKCVRSGLVGMLDKSFVIFYEDYQFFHLTAFLQETYELIFNDEAISHLRLYLLSWSNNEVKLPLSEQTKEELIAYSVKLIMLHLKYNFTSTFYQAEFLTAVCKSGISDIYPMVDFCLLKDVFELVLTVDDIEIELESLLEKKNTVYEDMLDKLLELKKFDHAIKLSTILGSPICDIVYSKWTNIVDINSDNFDFNLYESEIEEHCLPPEILVNFLLYTATQYQAPSKKKYLMLKKVLDVIKTNHLFPNESFDRDQIEYEMILCYLEMEENDLSQLEIYHSEYFEEIMMHERCVLYKSFLELKELAGIEDLMLNLKSELNGPMKERLTDLLNTLLDKGDIVEALRLQALFDFRPIDLHFIVFCMALAEGLTTIFNLSIEERLILSEVEMISFSKFNKRTLGHLSPEKNHETSGSSSGLEFEEIPSKEKQETLEALQGLASKLKHGINIGKRIVMTYRSSMYLDKEYVDVLRTKDLSILLKSAAEDGCQQKLLVISDIMMVNQMTDIEIADYLAFEIATAVIRPRFYIFAAENQKENLHSFKNSSLWGFELDRIFHLILELCPKTTILGNYLIEYCDALKVYRRFQDNKPYEKTDIFEKLQQIIQKYGFPNQTTFTKQVLSHKKQNIISVELLIKSHQTFVHECSMEGIANVLNRAKALNTILTNAKSWSLLVRMLTGIGRYREMYYCFDSLIRNDQFESLLGQFDEEKTQGLRHGIISYIHEYCPQNIEYLRLAALHFLMYKELAEIWEQDAKTAIAKILAMSLVNNEINVKTTKSSTTPDGKKSFVSQMVCSKEVIQMLNQAMDSLTHAAENYLLDNSLRLAQKSAESAQLIAMQIDLVTKGLSNQNQLSQPLCICVLSVRSWNEFKEIVNTEISVPQALILSKACSYEINWSEAILNQFIVLSKKNYLLDFIELSTLTDGLIENIVKGYQIYTNSNKIERKMEENVCMLVQLVQSVTLKYKLASLLSLKSILLSLINEQPSYYLKDTNYGKNENEPPDV